MAAQIPTRSKFYCGPRHLTSKIKLAVKAVQPRRDRSESRVTSRKSGSPYLTVSFEPTKQTLDQCRVNTSLFLLIK
jgi:hypothetical protein